MAGIRPRWPHSATSQRGRRWHQLDGGGSSGAGERFWIAVIPLHLDPAPQLRQRRVGDLRSSGADLLAQIHERLLAAT